MDHFDLILIDGNFFTYRLLTSMPAFDLQYKSERQGSFLIYNFLNSLQSILKQFTFNNLIICWDSKINKRKEIYPDYKANRKVRTEEQKERRKHLYGLMNYLKEELKTLGQWANVEKEGYEGDDLIAYFVLENNRKCLIASSDNDLYQLLLKDKVFIYLIKDKKVFTEQDFEDEYKITVENWPLIKSIIGDKTDNIKGIYGIGIKTAIKYYLDEKEPEKFDNLVNDNSTLIAQNYQIIKLPIDNDINLKLPQCYFDQEKWIEMFQKNGLRKLNLNDFKLFLNKSCN